MASFDTIRPEPERHSPSLYASMARWIRRRLPTGLYARSLLIIVLPMVLLQVAVSIVFMERHWHMVTQRLTNATTRDIAAIIYLITRHPAPDEVDETIRLARDRLGLLVSISPGTELPPGGQIPIFGLLEQTLGDEIETQIGLPYWIDILDEPNTPSLVDIRILLHENKILRVLVKRNETYASNTHIFILWMVGTAAVLITLSVLFLRGQIRPIVALAKAAEAFGKGQKMPESFSPRGADEIRRAGLAFILMRERIERQMEQRTAMLTGVSHDLRTILTRFKLQLALAGDNPDLAGLNEDVEDMQSMLEGYMAFARGEAEEDLGKLDLGDLFAKLASEAEMHGKTLSWSLSGERIANVRPNAFSRLVANLVSNSLRYASRMQLAATQGGRWLTITLDDDGPGIPAASREDVFKPFYRLDEARNLDDSGTGLGLAIARDIARSHGGNVTLEDSPLGGLRAIVRVPV
ncbi:ATP-binding protein [Gellertiella hungarica]|uniref:histidine kinase n=1 Tax=Gellertiella hungarica TaxID=1572859 RepID=A0A7W6J2A6_9HYPH|nr:ATP-binding protein [Gellertiella hungarica]MBB4063417.1 two-component system osmolarity sensor histidine kinase EnvZ [Gellertiella hungarica]